MHRMIGEILDDSQQQRDQYTKLAQRLWIGDYGTGMFSNANKQFNDSKNDFGAFVGGSVVYASKVPQTIVDLHLRCRP